jgi:hypothetical protein
MSAQKVTKNGRKVINRLTGTPVFNRSVNHRIQIAKDILYIGCNKQDRKWAEMAAELRTT